MRVKNFSAGLILALALGAAGESGHGAESLGDQVKKLFATPTPTPRKHKPKTKSSPTPTPTATPKSAKKKASPSPSPKPKKSASPSETPATKHTTTAEAEESASATPEESVTPKHKRSSKSTEPSPSPRRKRSKTSPEEEESASPSKPSLPKSSPSEAAEATASPNESASQSASAKPRRGAPLATIEPSRVVGYEKYSAGVRKTLDMAISLTTQDLDYKYGSADPASGGMDCSGFIYYVLSQRGLKDVPRDAREQYIWVRKAGTFHAVLGRHDDTFELDELQPGDLLFWEGTYQIDRDPPITHVMIYVGREKGTNQRIMVGASDGRTYKGESRFGVSIFDFKVARSNPKPDNGSGPMFVGYGRIPGLPED